MSSDSNKDGTLTFNELHTYIGNNIKKSKSQTPTISGNNLDASFYRYLVNGLSPEDCKKAQEEYDLAGQLYDKKAYDEADTHINAALQLWKENKDFRRLKTSIQDAVSLQNRNLSTDKSKATRYYSDYIIRWGVPKGLNEKTVEQIKKLQYHYQITEYSESGSKRVCLAHVNSDGRLYGHENTEWAFRPTKSEYSPFDFRNKEEEISWFIRRSIFRGDPGATIRQDKMNVFYTPDPANPHIVSVSYTAAGARTTPFSMPASMTGMSVDSSWMAARSAITGAKLYLGEQGFVEYMMYTNSKDEWQQDSSGVFGIRYERDQQGRIISETFLEISNPEKSKDGPDIDQFTKITNNKQGIAQRRYEYYPAGDLCSVTNFDLNLKPVKNERGWMKRVYSYDENGNRSEIRYYDCIDGKDVSCNNKEGIALVKCEYSDGKGNRTQESYFDSGNNPCSKLVKIKDALRENYHKATWEYSVPDSGAEGDWIVTSKYYDKADNPCIELCNGHFILVKRYSKEGNWIEAQSYDIQGNLCFHKGGNCIVKWLYVYDDNGNKIRADFFGKDGKLFVKKGDQKDGGYASYDRKLNQYGNRVIEIYYGPGRIPFAEYGEHTQEEIIKNDKESVLVNSSGYSVIKWEYDSQGNLIAESYFLRRISDTGDVIDIPVKSIESGCERIEWAYDSTGEKISEAYLNSVPVSEGKKEGYAYEPCIRDGCGYASIKWSYFADSVVETYYNEMRKPCNCPEGFAGKKYMYNQSGELKSSLGLPLQMVEQMER